MRRSKRDSLLSAYLRWKYEKALIAHSKQIHRVLRDAGVSKENHRSIRELMAAVREANAIVKAERDRASVFNPLRIFTGMWLIAEDIVDTFFWYAEGLSNLVSGRQRGKTVHQKSLRRFDVIQLFASGGIAEKLLNERKREEILGDTDEHFEVNQQESWCEEKYREYLNERRRAICGAVRTSVIQLFGRKGVKLIWQALIWLFGTACSGPVKEAIQKYFLSR